MLNIRHTKNQTITQALSGAAGLAWYGQAILTLSGLNTNTGETSIYRGKVIVTNKLSTGGINLGSGAEIDYRLTANRNVTFLKTLAGATPSLVTLRPTANVFFTINGVTTLGAPLKIIKVSGAAWAAIVLTGVRGGTSGVDQLIFSNLGGIQLYVQGSAGIYDYEGSTRFLTSNGSRYVLQGINPFSVKSTLFLDAGARVSCNSKNTVFAVDGLNGSGVWDTFNATTSTLSIGNNNGSGVFSGRFINSSGVTKIIKTGTGEQQVSGNNTHTGGTQINGGTYACGSSVCLGTTGQITVAAGATLKLNGFYTEAGLGARLVNNGGTVLP